MTTSGARDTIFARASGAGRAGVAVYRISGPAAPDLLRRMTGKDAAPRRIEAVRVRDPETGATVDRGLAILFHRPKSFTGEDVAELHLHGSRAVEAHFFDVLARLGGRPAEAGEFTRRALMNGKLDLAEVEGLADLLDAETIRQKEQALAQAAGRLSGVAEGWRAQLIAVLAPLEADIDFPDEEGVPAAVAARAAPAIAALAAELKSYLAAAPAAEAVREGMTIALIGAPNAGKSSLLNRLAGDEKAIVSDRPGTTRDIIEVRMDLAGLAVTLADTAGLRRETSDEIEIEGARRAEAKARAADLRVLVIDPRQDVSRETLGLLRPGDFVVFNKADLRVDLGSARACVLHGLAEQGEARIFALSAATGERIGDFLDALSDAAAAQAAVTVDGPLTRARHRAAATEAAAALEAALTRVESAPELAAEDARLAARALGRITGAVDVEDVLDEIFSSFCIGK